METKDNDYQLFGVCWTGKRANEWVTLTEGECSVMSNTRFEYFSFGQFEYSDIIVTHKQAVHLKERAT